MFESIKKKFSNATKKLSRKVSEDAIKEDNIKKIESSDEMSQSPQFDQVAQIELEESNEKNLASKDNETEKIIDNKNSDVDEFLEDEKFLKIQKNDESFENEEILESQEVQEGFESEKVVESQEVQETTKDDEKSKDNKTNEKQNFGFFSFIREKKISQKDIEDILWELELSLLESDVAIDVANTVIESVKEDLIGQKIKRSKDIEEFTYKALKNAVSEIISIDGKTMTEMIEEKNSKGQPLIVMFVGINGTGKTTTIAKISNYYLKMGYTPVVAASDTFRAGAIEQLTHHTDNLNVKIIKHQKGSDPAAVAYDAVEHAKAKDKELVLIDTAGRMQTNTNLMDEMKKIKRVAKPDIVVFVGDALTGNDAVEQAIKFNNAIDIDGVILTKADADSKGGASLSIGYVISKPIMFLGMGQGYDDIKEYDSEWMLEQIFS